ncbi:MAG: alcohol dehydrogenase catalytic domain-containing protein [Pseudomonadota bacterium]
MKALVYTGPEAMEMRDVAMPTAGEDVLIKIEACGICGSDMHAYLGHDARRPAPLILGHEGAGVIQGGARDGERVTVNPLVTRGDCEYNSTGRENLCQTREIISMPPREGAFAEFLTMPAENLVTVPDDVPLSKAALAEPLAVSWHAAKLGLGKLHMAADRSVLILGGGAIGAGSALCLKAMGVEEITVVEPNDARRAYLEDAIGLNAIAKADKKYGIVVDAVGYAATRATASAHVKPGGVIIHIGLGEDEGGLDIRYMTLQEVTFVGSYCYTPADFKETCDAIFDGSLGPLDWIEERPLVEGWQSFKDIRAGAVQAPKIILRP